MNLRANGESAVRPIGWSDLRRFRRRRALRRTVVAAVLGLALGLVAGVLLMGLR